MNAFGEFRGRDGVVPINVTISDDKIQELIEAQSEDEDKFAMLAMDFEGEDNMSISEYCVRESIVRLIEDNKYIILPLGIIEEEYTFGCAMSEDDARIAFTKAK